MSEGSAYYWPFNVPGWLGGAPDDWDWEQTRILWGRPHPDSWKEVVFDRRLSVGIRVTAERWGLVRFDFQDWPPGMRSSVENESFDFDVAVEVVMRRLKVMNIHLLMAHVALLDIDNLATDTVHLSHFDIVNYRDDGMGGPGLWRIPFVVGHQDVGRHFVIGEGVLTRSVELLDQVMSGSDTHWEQYDLILLGHSMFQQHDYAQALIAAWAVSEQLVSEKWRGYLAQLDRDVTLSDGTVVRRINADRRQALVQNPDYPMARVTQILELSDQLDHELFRSLNTVRKSRNDWLHNLIRPDATSAALALTSACELLTESTAIPVRLGLGRSISGP